MMIHHPLHASYGVFGASHSLSFSQPDHLAQPPCSSLRSSHSEFLCPELVLQDVFANSCQAVQESCLKVKKLDLIEHSVGINSHKELDSCNDRHQGIDRTRSDHFGDSNRSVFDLLQGERDMLVEQDLKDLDSNGHFPVFEKQSKLGRPSSLRAQLEEQTIEEALAFLEGIIDEPLPASIFIPILKKCRKEKSLASAQRIHLHMCKHGLECHGVLKNLLITIYVNSGFVYEAKRAVNRLRNIDQHSWNTLIQGYLDSGESKSAFKVYKEMEGKFVPSRRYILMALLQTFAAEQCLEECQELHAKIVERELENDRFFCNTLIDISELGQIIHMEILCRGFEKHNRISSVLVYMYAKNALLAEAQSVLDNFQSRDAAAWNVVMKSFVEQGLCETALSFLNRMEMENVRPDVATWLVCMKACQCPGLLHKVYETHSQILKQGLEQYSCIHDCIASMYAFHGSFEYSKGMFDRLHDQDSSRVG
ncbi:hypothetical protein L7F22_011681 [Adiantum nelumboides]|nr:hypothetical protein [Adiantum nelumboides]